ncbi:hypothetical protein B0T20DRAFT_361052 [Sordaria brevicollis]|uniref:NACHT-NTPase and P-loop NTPases N-terminal domain-containing protein n=1 Tax=Sordaria brevicollis TaxID=83679 RepID=A0AAE0P2K3_SORBR|nr:hypothetical protein B0T20DRAFT_361052 [Sordaria brevicollis]
MSGLEVLSVASSIISIVDAISKVISASRDIHGLPEAVRDTHTRLPLVVETLRLATECMNQSQHNNDQDPTTKKSCKAMLRVLQACEEKVTLLGTIFNAVLPAGTTRPSARKRFTTAAIMTLHVGKSRKVESLMKGILQDIQLLANNRALDEATRDKMKARIEMSAPAENNTNASPSSSSSGPVCDGNHESQSAHSPSVHPSLSEGQSSSVPLSPSSQGPNPGPQPVRYGAPNSFHNYSTGTQNVHSGHGNQNVNMGQGHFFTGTVTGPIHFSTAASC